MEIGERARRSSLDWSVHRAHRPLMNRRTFLTTSAGAAAGMAASGAFAAGHAPVDAQREDRSAIELDPTPLFDLSPYLFMQFMEPLGATDGSVEAAWDHLRDDWRDDVVAMTRELGPTMMRWGGIFADFYRWREGVGPRDAPTADDQSALGRHRVEPGRHRRVRRPLPASRRGAAHLRQLRIGRPQAIHERPRSGAHGRRARKRRPGWRTATIRTIASGKSHGHAAPLSVRHWQIGNETSYDKNGFDVETAARKTVEFAKAMRAADPAIQLIAWGDSGWAARMAEVAGEHVQYLAFHHMFDPDSPRQPVLRGEAVPARSRCDVGAIDGGVAAGRRQDSLRSRHPGLPQDSARDDGVPLRHSGPRSRRRALFVGGRRLVRAHPEHASTAWRRAEDRDGGGLLRHAVAEQRRDHSDAEGQQPRVSSAGGPRDAALSPPHRQSRDQSGWRAGRPRRRREPPRRDRVPSRREHAAHEIGHRLHPAWKAMLSGADACSRSARIRPWRYRT